MKRSFLLPLLTAALLWAAPALAQQGPGPGPAPITATANTFTQAQTFSGGATVAGTLSGDPGASGLLTFSNSFKNVGDAYAGIHTGSNQLRGFHVGSLNTFCVSSTSSADGTCDTFLGRKGAANWILGGVDLAAPVAQTISCDSVASGTSNASGVSCTIIGSLSTGSGTSGDIIIQTGGTGAGAAVVNSPVTALTIKGATQLVQLTAITTDATRTDATVCEDTTTHALYSGSGTLGICLGTSSARFKHNIAGLTIGLDAILRLRPISYYLNADHGDPYKQLLGFTAEQMREVIPQLVGLDAKGLPNTADYMGLIPVLVRAVQQQQAEISALKALIAHTHSLH